MGKFLSKYFKHGDQKKISKLTGITETQIGGWRVGRHGATLFLTVCLIKGMSEYYGIPEEDLWLELYKCL